jgi:arsenite-transporting ATPase
LLGDAHQGPFFHEWRIRQEGGLASLDETFSAVTQLEAPLEAIDLVGPDRLATIGKQIYGDVDPSSRLSPVGRGIRFDRDGDRVVLRVPLPGVDPRTVHAGRTALDVVLTAGAHRRVIPLPDALRSWRGEAARFEGDELHVAFVEA